MVFIALFSLSFKIEKFSLLFFFYISRLFEVLSKKATALIISEGVCSVELFLKLVDFFFFKGDPVVGKGLKGGLVLMY